MHRRVDLFYDFARARKPAERVPTECIAAMEEGTLWTCAENKHENYLWEACDLDINEWVRMCTLLQQQHVDVKLLWRSRSYIGAKKSKQDRKVLCCAK
jgi:hypothetical protein